MPQNPEPATEFIILNSNRLPAAGNFLHAVSVMACYLNSLPIIFKLALTLFICRSWFVQFKAKKTHKTYLRYTSSGDWEIFDRKNDYQAIRILPSTVISGILSILHFNIEGQKNALPICNDAMTKNQYRKLLVLLKISG